MSETGLQKLGENHETMITAMVIEGLSQKEVLERYDISPSRLSTIMRSGVWKQKIAKVRREHTKQLYVMFEAHRELAIKKISELISDGKSEAVQLKAAQDLLDRTGMPKNTIVTHEESPEIRELVGMAKEYVEKRLSLMAELGITDLSELEGVVDVTVVR